MKKIKLLTTLRLGGLPFTTLAVVLGFAAIGTIYVVLSHAASTAVSSEPENGAVTGSARSNDDSTASGGRAVVFSASTAGEVPMELLNRRSDVKIMPTSAAAASDGNYNTSWNPGSTGTVNYDLSALPDTKRSSIMLAWYSSTEDGRSAQVFMNGDCVAYQRSIAQNYTIQVNSAAGGAVPSGGWVTTTSVNNNIYFSRQHLINMIDPTTNRPYNWIRMSITSSVSGLNMNIDIANASQGVSGDIFFIGDSITTRYAGREQTNGAGQNIGPNIADLVSQMMGPSYHLITQNGGVACSKSSDWGSVYSTFSPQPTIDNQLALFPGNYVTLNLGTNDLGGDPSSYYATMEVLVKKIIAAGKIPILPKIPWPNGGYPNASAQSYNAKLDLLASNYPKSIKGPDLYATLVNKPGSWFDGNGNVHPNGSGIVAIRCAWAYSIVENVYGRSPAALPACNGFAAP